MLEIQGNLWDFHKEGHPICITTNGFVKKNGRCVMGRGIAQQAALRYPDLQSELGDRITTYGNRVFYLRAWNIFSFPVKHNWWEAADPVLIRTSVDQLDWQVGNNGFDVVYLPRPGCDNGRLAWDVVKPLLSSLDDRYIICDLKS